MRARASLFFIICLSGGWAQADQPVNDAIPGNASTDDSSPVSASVYESAKATGPKHPKAAVDPIAKALKLESEVNQVRAKEEANSPELAKLLVEKYLSKGVSVGRCKIDPGKSKIMDAATAGITEVDYRPYSGKVLVLEGNLGSHGGWIKVAVPVTSLIVTSYGTELIHLQTVKPYHANGRSDLLGVENEFQITLDPAGRVTFLHGRGRDFSGPSPSEQSFLCAPQRAAK